MQDSYFRATDNATAPTPSYKKQHTDYSGNYDADFLIFSQKYLESSLNHWVMDIDSFVIRKRSGSFMLLEIKRNNYPVKPHQRITIKIVDALIRAGMSKTKGLIKAVIGGARMNYRVKYHGYNVLTLSSDRFDNSSFKWNGRYVSMEELIKKLAMAN